MRILTLADLQLQAYKEFSSVNSKGYNSRAYDLVERLTKIIREKNEEEPLDGVCVLGDFWDNRFVLEVDLLDLAHDALARWSKMCPVYLLEGNHDQFQKSGLLTSLRQFQSFCEVIRKPETRKIGGESIAFSPYHPNLEVIKEGLVKLQGSGAKYLFGHWTVAGASTGSATLEKGVEKNFPALAGYKHILLGDIHKHQYLTDNMLYLGSPVQHDFGERGDEKCVWLLDDEGLTPIPTELPCFIVTSDLEEAVREKEAGNYVEYIAKSEGNSETARNLGFRIKNDYKVSIAGEDRPLIETAEEAVRHWVSQQGREDILELGLGYIKENSESQDIPNHHITLGNLKAGNFMSYSELEVDLSNEWGVVLLNGEVVGDEEYDSNGAGKTTVYEAIYFALFGKTLRYGSSNKRIVKKGEEQCFVQLDFSVESKSYRIERSIPGSLRILIPQDEESDKDNLEDGWDSRLTMGTMAATQALLIKLIGDSDVFLRLTLLALHYYPSFLALDDSKKKEFIDRAAGTEIFDRAYDSVSEDYTKLKGEVRDQQKEIEFSQRQIEKEKEFIEDQKKDLDDHVKRESLKAEEAKEEAESLRKRCKDLVLEDEDSIEKPQKKPLEDAIQEHEESIKKKEKTIEGLKEDQQQILEKIASIEKCEAKEAEEEVESQEKLLEEVKSTEKEMDDEIFKLEADMRLTLSPLREELKKSQEFEGWKPGDVCSTCGYTFTEKDDQTTHYKHVKSKIPELEKSIEATRSELEPPINEAKEAKKEVLTLLSEVQDQLQEAKKRSKDVQKEVQELREEHKELGEDIEEIRGEIEELREKIKNLEVQINGLEKDHQRRLEQLRERNREQEKKRTQLLEKAKVLEAFQPDPGDTYKNIIKKSEKKIEEFLEEEESKKKKLLEIEGDVGDVEFWKTAFGTRGCKSLLYTGFLDSLNASIQKYADAVSGGTFNIQLLPYSEGRKSTQEKISLQVKNYAGSDSFEGDSLGERARIDIPVNLAVRDAVALRGLSFNFLFADEPWLGLDDSGKRAVYRVFEAIQSNGCPSVIITDQSKFSKGFLRAKSWVARKTVENNVPKSVLITEEQSNE